MVFVMDQSGSIGERHFGRMKQLAINITASFTIAPDRTRVAWISFNSAGTMVFNLNQYTDRTSLHRAIRNVDYAGGGTDIGEAVETLRLHGFTGGRNNFDVPEVAIVLTDGRTNDDTFSTALAADNLQRDRNVNVFVVGVGDNVNRDELMAVASAGIETTEDHIEHIDRFDEDELNTLQETIRARTCFGEYNTLFILVLYSTFVDAMFSNHDTSLERLNNEKLSIPHDVTVHVAVECPVDGLTINACGRTGETHLYISRTRPPNSASYEEILVLNPGQCKNTFINCNDGGNRGRRQAEERIFITIEGVGEENVYDLNATMGDSSTPQGMCAKIP